MSFTPGDFGHFSLGGFTVSQTGRLHLRYELSGAGGKIPFLETWTFPRPHAGDAASHAFERLARLLYLACSVSYFKVSAPAYVHLQGEWSRTEIQFFQALISDGLAEFAHRNGLAVPLRPEVSVDEVRDAPSAIELPSTRATERALTPVGGGKDSCVTIDALRRHGRAQTLFAVGKFQAIERVAEVARLPLVTVHRSLSENLFTLNRQGALNGHVPVTSVNSIAALMGTAGASLGDVFMSNERSATTPTVYSGHYPVNHQWSKSIEFEDLLRRSVHEHVRGVEYASLLRPYSEYRIAERFAQLDEFHDSFVSCGRAFTRSRSPDHRWCGRCAKCQFVTIVLSPFLSRQRVVDFMGVDALAMATAMELGPLVGVNGGRPYECVGEVAETRFALLGADASWRAVPSVAQLSDLLGNWSPSTSERSRILEASSEHRLPTELSGVLDDC
jgi:hypothetical protein